MTRALASLALGALLGACAAGPDFHRPAAPEVAQFGAAPAPAAVGVGRDRVLLPAGQEATAGWWTGFGSAAIDAAVARALEANPDLASARAALRVAGEQAAAQRGSFWPAFGADVSATRQRSADSLSPTLNSGQNPYTLYTGQLSVGYGIDLFGGERRALESAMAAADYQRFEFEAARASVVANLVVALVRASALHGEADAARRMASLQAEVLAIAERQLALGAISQGALGTQRALLAQAEASLAAAEKAAVTADDLVAALEGGFPATQAVPRLDLEALTLPAVPLAMPGRLVEQRPDVRAAEALCHAASANIGVATAAMLPSLTLTGTLGRISQQGGSLVASGDRTWGVGADLGQVLFAGGSLLHRRRAAQAAYEQSLAAYRSTVVAAFQNVADALGALGADSTALEAARTSEAAAVQLAALTTRQVEAGDQPRIASLQAQAAAEAARAARLDAQATRIADLVGLVQALGGRWAEPPPAR